MEHRPLPVLEKRDNILSADINCALHYFDGCCCYCGVKLIRESGSDNSLEFDHFFSVNEQLILDRELIIDGTIQNRVPSCRSCNRSKSDKNPLVWIKENFKNSQEIIDTIEMFLSTQREYL